LDEEEDLYKPNDNCKSRTDNYNSNLITSLLTYGDCRDLSLLLEFYLCYIEWKKYLYLLKNFDSDKIINLIKNQNRMINVDVYMTGYYERKLDIMKPLNNKINKKDILLYKNKKYIYYENHNFVVSTKNGKFITRDIMYNKYDLSLTENKKKFYGEYIVNDKNIIINDTFIELGQNDFYSNLNIIAKIKQPFFINYRYETKLKKKLFYLSEKFKIPNIFYNINEFIIKRENQYYELRKEMYNKNIKVNRYTKTSTNNSYFLLEDI
jgi:hypothetical protein